MSPRSLLVVVLITALRLPFASAQGTGPLPASTEAGTEPSTPVAGSAPEPPVAELPIPGEMRSEEPVPQEAAPEPRPRTLHAALRAPSWLLLEGSQRTRYSALANQFRPGLDEDDQALSLRTLLSVGLRLAAFRLVLEVQDARAYLLDAQSGASTIVVDALEPLQAYVGLELADALTPGDRLELRAGRQTLDLGGRRLVARNRFRNTIQGYDGVAVRWRTAAEVQLDLFVLLPVLVEPGNDDRDALLANRVRLDRERIQLSFWGVHHHQPLGKRIALETYFFGLTETDGADFATRNRRLYTPGIRLERPAASGQWDLDLESVLQGGSRRSSPEAADVDDRPVLAHFHHLAVGYTLPVSWSVRLAAEMDYATGDDPGTDRYERFDSLYGPRRTDFGPTGIYGPLGRENIVSAGARVGVRPHPRVDAYVSWRANWLARADDMFARTGVRDPEGRSGRFAGHQVEFRGRLALIPRLLQWELGGALFVQGPFLEDAPNATGYGDPLFIYTDLELVF